MGSVWKEGNRQEKMSSGSMINDVGDPKLDRCCNQEDFKVEFVKLGMPKKLFGESPTLSVILIYISFWTPKIE